MNAITTKNEDLKALNDMIAKYRDRLRDVTLAADVYNNPELEEAIRDEMHREATFLKATIQSLTTALEHVKYTKSI